MLRLIGKRVAVVPPDEARTLTGIYIGPDARPLKGKAVIVSPEAAQLGIHPGNTIYFGRRAGMRVEQLEGPELIVLTIDEVLAVDE